MRKRCWKVFRKPAAVPNDFVDDTAVFPWKMCERLMWERVHADQIPLPATSCYISSGGDGGEVSDANDDDEEYV